MQVNANNYSEAPSSKTHVNLWSVKKSYSFLFSAPSPKNYDFLPQYNNIIVSIWKKIIQNQLNMVLHLYINLMLEPIYSLFFSYLSTYSEERQWI